MGRPGAASRRAARRSYLGPHTRLYCASVKRRVGASVEGQPFSVEWIECHHRAALAHDKIAATPTGAAVDEMAAPQQASGGHGRPQRPQSPTRVLVSRACQGERAVDARGRVGEGSNTRLHEGQVFDDHDDDDYHGHVPSQDHGHVRPRSQNPRRVQRTIYFHSVRRAARLTCCAMLEVRDHSFATKLKRCRAVFMPVRPRLS
jgi:hypothetical protein